MDNKTIIEKTIADSLAVKESVKATLIPSIEHAAGLLIECLKNGGKGLTCGNGGSAAEAQHMAGELVGRFMMERQPLPCVALSTNSSVLTAIGNDYDFESVFERQVEALGKEGDVFIGISTSGNSKNVVRAMQKAKGLGLKTIGLLGGDGGLLRGLADVSIVIPSKSTPRIQESHTMIMHILCELVEKALFDEKN